MMPHVHSPWFFVRDEFDLLEEEVDAVFVRHDKGMMDPKAHAMEDDVIEEHLQTEAGYDVEWEASLEDDADVEPCHEHAFAWFDQPRPLRELLAQHQTRDPLYLRAFRWAERLFAWSGEAYERTAEKNRDLFRVQVNVSMVPVKIALAREEEWMDDAIGCAWAADEFALALVYLDRSLDSLQRLCEQPAFSHRLGSLWKEGILIRRQIERQCAELVRRLQLYQNEN